MVVLALELGESAPDVVTVSAAARSQRMPDGITLNERHTVETIGGRPVASPLFVVVEYVGPKFDLEAPREITLEASATDGAEPVCAPFTLTVALDIEGEPFVLHPRGPE